MRLPQWLAYGLAPAVLVLGVAMQRYNVAVHDQTQWTGGGFGMFSTVDVPGARALRAYVLTDRGEALLVEPDLGAETRLVYTQPTAARLEAAARHLAGRDWRVYEPSSYQTIWPSLPSFLQRYFRSSGAWQAAWSRAARSDSMGSTAGLYPGHLAFDPRRVPYNGLPTEVEIEGARVEVWRPVFDPDAGQLAWTLLAEATAPRDPAARDPAAR